MDNKKINYIIKKKIYNLFCKDVKNYFYFLKNKNLIKKKYNFKYNIKKYVLKYIFLNFFKKFTNKNFERFFNISNSSYKLYNKT
jgi:hypothetical protein